MLFGKKITVSILSLIIFTHTMLCIARARSVYVITNIGDSTIKAYDIQNDQIEYQATVENLQSQGLGAVALALDPDSQILFVTYEDSGIIEMLNAKTMLSEQNPVTVPGAASLAEITVNAAKKCLIKTGDFNIIINIA